MSPLVQLQRKGRATTQRGLLTKEKIMNPSDLLPQKIDRSKPLSAGCEPPLRHLKEIPKDQISKVLPDKKENPS